MQCAPVDAGAPVADHDVAPAGKRLAHQEQGADPTALVLIILPGWPAARDRPGRVDLAGQLAAGLVQADLRVARVIGPGVNLKHVLHAPAELTSCSGGMHQRWVSHGLRRFASRPAAPSRTTPTRPPPAPPADRPAAATSSACGPGAARCMPARPGGPPAPRPDGGGTGARAPCGTPQRPAPPRRTACGSGPRWRG